MKKIENICLVLLLAGLSFCMGSCCKSDMDDIRSELQKQDKRIADLEEWQKEVNADIISLQGLVGALQGNDYVTAVAPLADGTGYTITFEKSGTVTIRNGKDGATPVVSAKKDADGKYYWTVDGEWLTDGGNKLPVAGERGIAPQVRINSTTGEWEISADEGQTWSSTGVAAKGEQGDSIFRKDGIDTLTDPDNVIFTLADGSTLTVPKALALSVGFDSYGSFQLTPFTDEVKIMLPSTLRETDYTAMVAEINTAAGTDMDICTRASAQPWKVTLTKPEFIDGKYQDNAKVKIEAGADAANGDKAVLKITVINDRGREISVSRAVEYFNGAVVYVEQLDGLEAAVKAAIEGSGINDSDIKGVKITGTIGFKDFSYIYYSLSSVECVDISGTDLKELSYLALGDTDTPNTTIREIVLPEGLTKIEGCAFYNCKALEKLNIPSTVTELGGWMVTGCENLKSINIPAGVSEIPESCFYDSGLTTIDIPNTVEAIGRMAFDSCPLESVVIPESVTSLGEYAFACSLFFEDKSLAQLREVVVKANVTEIPGRCFYQQDCLAKVTLPDCVKTIGSGAFELCRLKEINLPEDLEEISARGLMLGGYTDVPTLILPSKVRTVGCQAFNCWRISTIDLPATATSLHAVAFGWEDASKVICRATSVPETPQEDGSGGSVFRPFYLLKSGCRLQVPAESLAAYKSAWGQYFGEDNIEAIQ